MSSKEPCIDINDTDAEKKKPRSHKPLTRREKAEPFLLALAVSLAVFVLSPLYIISGSREEFPLDFLDMMATLAIAGIANVILAGGMLLLLKWKLRRVYGIVSRIIAGFLPAFFVQAVFLNNPHTAMTGYQSGYYDFNISTYGNLLIYVLIVSLPLLIKLAARLFPKKKLLPVIDRNTIFCVAAAAVIVQAGWTGVKMSRTDFDSYCGTYKGYLSYENAMSLSEEGNIVVFLVDRLDGTYVDEMLERYPELNEKLGGFTFYQNNVSHTTNTFPSVVQMLTGEQYDGREWPEYMRSAWDEDCVPAQLKKAGYDINIIPDSITTVSTPRLIEDFCDNINYYSGIEKNRCGDGGVVYALSKLSLARLLPNKFKGTVASGLGANVARHFVKPAGDEPADRVPLRLEPQTDLHFCNYMNENGLRADNPNKTFTYIHLSGAHYNSRELAELYKPLDEELDPINTTRGDFEILFSYFDQLKELGIYDKTTIVILGDHGRAPNETDSHHKKLKGAITTALLIKPAGDAHGELAFDRYSELSNDNFPASILEFAGIDHSCFGNSYSDIIKNDLHPDRYFQSVKFVNYGSLQYTARYRITGDARDFDNWELLPEHENSLK